MFYIILRHLENQGRNKIDTSSNICIEMFKKFPWMGEYQALFKAVKYFFFFFLTMKYANRKKN